MSVMNNIAAMFRPTQQVTAAPPPSPMAQQNPGADPATLQAPAAAPAPANPLDAFQSIWQTPDPSKSEPDPLAAPLLNADPGKIRQAAAKMDFTAGITPDLMQKAMGGQDPQAFIQVMNLVAQQAVATSAQLSSATVEHATRANNARMLQALPKHVNQVQLDAMAPQNPVLQHPSAQPMLKMIRGQIQAAEPTLTPAEVNAKAEAYLGTFAQALTPAPTPAPAAAGETDWSAYGGLT